jgi:hypothetical protein
VTGTSFIARERSRIAAAIYGTILVLAVLSYLSEDDQLGDGDIAIAMVTTAIAYFSAHIYVDYLSARMTGARERTLVLFREVVREEWPLLQATLVPGIPLLLGAFGVYSKETGVDLALGVAFVDLVGWGYAAGRRSYKSRLGAIGSACVAIALGALVVSLKNILH